MKKIIISLFAVFSAALIFSGCTSFETNRAGHTLSLELNAKAKPDIEIGKDKVAGNSSVNCLFGIFTWGVDKQAVGVDYGTGGSSFLQGADSVAKNGAAFDACTKSQADILVAPRYNITTKDYFVFKKVDCEVEGFPGKLNSVEVQK